MKNEINVRLAIIQIAIIFVLFLLMSSCAPKITISHKYHTVTDSLSGCIEVLPNPKR